MYSLLCVAMLAQLAPLLVNRNGDLQNVSEAPLYLYCNGGCNRNLLKVLKQTFKATEIHFHRCNSSHLPIILYILRTFLISYYFIEL